MKVAELSDDGFLLSSESFVSPGAACGGLRCEGAVDAIGERIDILYDEYADKNGKPKGSLRAINVVLGFMCDRTTEDDGCNPLCVRTEVRPASAAALRANTGYSDEDDSLQTS